MTITPLTDIIIYSQEDTFGLLGTTQGGLDYLRGRYGSLEHGTTAVISGSVEYVEAEFAAIDSAELQTLTMG